MWMNKHDKTSSGHKHSEPILENEEKRKAMILYMICTRMHDVEVKYMKEGVTGYVYITIDGKMREEEYMALFEDVLQALEDY